MIQFFGNKYVKGITQFIQDEHFGPMDYIDWYCEQMGLSREEYMAGYRIAMDLRLARVQESKDRDWNDPKPGPDPYDKGLDHEEIEDKEAQMKKQAKMDDDDPDAYKEMPGDAEAREKGKVKTSKHVKSYHELYGDDETNEALITSDDKEYLNQITSFLKKYKDKRGLDNDKKFTAEVIKVLKQRVSDRGGLVKKRFQKILKSIEKDFKSGNYLKLNESTILEKSKILKLKEWGIDNHVELKKLMDYLRDEDINWNQSGQSLKFDSAEDADKAKEWLGESFLNEGMYDPKNIKAYYEALCKAEGIKPLPVKFQRVGKGGAVTVYNSKTMKPLYISFDVNRLNDPEFAIIHELTHQIKLETEGDAYVGKRDRLAKFKKLENRLVDKYVYSEFSELLYEKSLILSEGVMSDLHQLAEEVKSEDEFVKKFFKEYGAKIKKSSDSVEWVKSLYQDTVEEKLTEAKRSKVYKAAKAGSYPAVVVVIQRGKVIHQELVNTPDVAPATFNVMQNKYPDATIHLEDNTGQRLFSESLVTENKNIPNSIGIISNKVGDALDILSNKNIKYKPLNKNIKGFEVYGLKGGNDVILALTILQKNNIKVLDTERLFSESLVTENKEKQSTDRTPLEDDAMETGLKNKAKETGVPIGIIRAVARRGLAAWKTGHRPGATQQQWSYARVNSFLTKQPGTWGGADGDLAKEVRDGGHDKKLKKA